MLLFVLSACEPEVNEKPDETYDPGMFQSGVCAFDSTDTIAPAFPNVELNTPEFPTLAVHVIWREWKFQDTAGFVDGYRTWSDYLDFRLNELYPIDAYPGVVNDAKTEYENYLDSFGAWEACYYAWEDFWGTPSDTIDGPPEPYVDPQGEFDLLDMSTAEIEKYERYDSVVFADTVVSYATMDSIVNQLGSYKKWGPGWTISAGAIAVVGGYLGWRSFQSRKNGIDKEETKYSQNPSKSGDYKSHRGDAFRHIYASVLLRKRATRAWAAFAGWLNEAGRRNNDVRDEYMDLHNNKVGRVEKYQDFKSGNKNAIADAVETWVDNHGSKLCGSSTISWHINMVCPLPDWKNNMPTESEAENFTNNRNKVDEDEYIVWK